MNETELQNQSQDQDRRNGFCDIFWFPNEFRRQCLFDSTIRVSYSIRFIAHRVAFLSTSHFLISSNRRAGTLLHNYSIKLCIHQEQKFGFKGPYYYYSSLIQLHVYIVRAMNVPLNVLRLLAMAKPYLKWLEIRSAANQFLLLMNLSIAANIFFSPSFLSYRNPK